MLNTKIGSYTEIDGRACLLARQGEIGHVVYGPYQDLGPGRYVVEFDVSLPETPSSGEEMICGIADVTADFGRTMLARKDVYRSELGRKLAPIRLEFEVDRPKRLEYRFLTNGVIPLLVGDNRRLLRVNAGDDVEALLAAHRFPDPDAPNMPGIFREHVRVFGQLHDRGALISNKNGMVVVTLKGVSFWVTVPDDLRFVDEIFFKNAYNIQLPSDTCVIDIGMNIGLVSLRLASLPQVKEVHSFEPFKSTYDRALRNINLNRSISFKMHPNNFGIAGKDEDLTVLVGNHGDSGMQSMRGDVEGTPTAISVRNAAAILGPIIASAEARGLRVIAKIDCEGAEFDIFNSLGAAGLLKHISAFMVEWHRVFDAKTQWDLINPLREKNFIIFDLTPDVGNGFFYAVRS